MSKKASNFQKVVMSWEYRGKEIYKPLNTGWVDDNVACVREWMRIWWHFRDDFESKTAQALSVKYFS